MDKIPSDEKRHSHRLLSAAVSCADRGKNCRDQRKNNKGTQYIAKSDNSPKKHNVSNCYKRDTDKGQCLTFNTVKWYPREGNYPREWNAKNDGKVHSLALEIMNVCGEHANWISCFISTIHFCFVVIQFHIKTQ